MSGRWRQPPRTSGQSLYNADMLGYPLFRTGPRLTPAMLTLAALIGCATPDDRGLKSHNPLDRVEAIVAATEAGDLSAVHKLVDLLEDSDEGVRMYAILGLRRLCNADYGYHYYASADERRAAVARWREALRQGQVVASPPDGGEHKPVETRSAEVSATHGAEVSP